MKIYILHSVICCIVQKYLRTKWTMHFESRVALKRVQIYYWTISFQILMESTLQWLQVWRSKYISSSISIVCNFKIIICNLRRYLFLSTCSLSHMYVHMLSTCHLLKTNGCTSRAVYRSIHRWVVQRMKWIIHASLFYQTASALVAFYTDLYPCRSIESILHN